MVDTCVGHIKAAIQTKKTSVNVYAVPSKSLDIDVLHQVLQQLTSLRVRLKGRFRTAPEKIITCLLCCSTGGCCDLGKFKRKRKQRISKYAKINHSSNGN